MIAKDDDDDEVEVEDEDEELAVSDLMFMPTLWERGLFSNRASCKATLTTGPSEEEEVDFGLVGELVEGSEV